MIKPKKAIRHVNNTLSGSMNTPALRPGIQLTDDEASTCPLPKKIPGTIENAKNATTTAIAITK